VVETSEGSSSTFRALIPSHGYRVECMQILEDFVFISLASEHNNSLSCKHGSMAEPSWRGSSLNPRFDPATRIQIKNMSVVQVGIAFRLASIKVSSKEQN